MKRTDAAADSSALVAFIAEALQRHLELDPPLLAACAGLRRSGASLVVRVEAAPGSGVPKVLALKPALSVPEWSAEDRELLRSVGIASENGATYVQPTAEPGRCDPR